MSLVMRKPAFCICENKDADQLLDFRKAFELVEHKILLNNLNYITSANLPSSGLNRISIAASRLCRAKMDILNFQKYSPVYP